MSEHSKEPLRIEPCRKRVRAMLGGQMVADSTHCKLVWEFPAYPWYYFPEADVRRELVPATALRVPGAKVLEGHVKIRWDAMDAWFEEEDEVYVHPHDPFSRVDILHGSRHVEIVLLGEKLADSHRPTLLFETGLPMRCYLPKSDVRMDLLAPTDKRTGCAYKGFARHWSVKAGGRVHENLAWSYPTPLPECAKIAGLVSFLDEVVDVTLDGVPQPRPVTEFSPGA